MLKIDCHVHLVGASPQSGCYISKEVKRSFAYRYIFWRFGLSKISDPAEQERLYVERIASCVEESQIDRVALLAFDKVYSNSGQAQDDLTHTYVPNDYVAKTCEQYPDVFLNCSSVHPYRKDALDELERVKENGAVLIKLLPNSQGFDPSESTLVPYYRKMKELGLPLLIHAGFEHTIPVIDQSLGYPEKLRTALDEGLKVIVAHCGSAGLSHFKETMGETLKLLRDYSNCYCDTSAMTNIWRSSYLIDMLNPERLQRKYGVQLESPMSRVLHGSDYPIPLTPSVFFFRLNKKYRKELKAITNPIEKDVLIKRYLGVPDSCLTRAYDELSIGR